MFNSTIFSPQKYYKPLGNSPAVCLTQDLPPEQDAHILCLGCGDARNVLFTCFADGARKIDVTCCDTEPGIHARNILLYSLLISDKTNQNVECIWNIYYNWKLDNPSADLLQKQTSKLLSISATLDKWHDSIFGTFIRFCDSRSLSLVRAYWLGFRLQGVSSAQKKERLYQLQCRIKNAKAHRDMKASNHIGARSASLVGTQAAKDLSEISKQWWNCGTTESSSRVTELNPAFLFSPNKALVLHCELSPLLGFPLSTAYVPIVKGSTFHVEQHDGISSTNFLVKSAKSHFNKWATAFRRAVENESVIRIFCGDPLAFSCTLHNCQLTGSTSMNLFCDDWTCSPLTLCESDYASTENMAPVSFDIIDVSNLSDHLGPLNVIGVASSLLKYHSSSSLYAEMSVQRDINLSDQLSGFFGVDVRTMSLLFGLVLPELFTNATNSPGDASEVIKVSKLRNSDKELATQVCSRLRWKRSCRYAEPYVHISARVLAKLLIHIHKAMFTNEDEEDDEDEDEDENLLFNLNFIFKQPSKPKEPSKRVLYSRASFAFFLHRLRATVVSDWNLCFKYIYHTCFKSESLAFSMSDFVQDLILNLHLFGVDNDIFSKPIPSELDNAILTPILPVSLCEDVPEQLCVTVRVPRKYLNVLDSEISTSNIVCLLKDEENNKPWSSMFSTVKVVFGTCYAETNRDSYPYIEEDTSQFLGTSDMFASFMVPTWMLLQSKCSVPTVECGIASRDQYLFFDDSSLDPCLVCCKMSSQDVFVSRFMPGMFALPTFRTPIRQKPTSTSTTVQLTYDGSRIRMLTQRVTLESTPVKAKLADKSSTVSVMLKSPLSAIVNIAQFKKLKFELPLPLSFSKPIVRIARKSSYIEIESPLFDPLQEDASTFIFPIIIEDDTVVPTLWTTTRVNLDVMPPVDVNDTQTVLLLTSHAKLMFSNREQFILESSGSDARTSLKNGLAQLFLQYACRKADIFELSKVNGGIQILVFPSCLRLDLVNHTIVLDAAVILLTDAMRMDSRVQNFLEELTNHNVFKIKVTESENNAWKAILPAFVERCRIWKHNPGCTYILEDDISLICSCGFGKFPQEDYLQSQMEKISDLSHIIGHYASRAAIAPIFAVPFVEECYRKGEVNINNNRNRASTLKKNCATCSLEKNELRSCSRCKKISYCSRACQKAHWRKHKSHCDAV